MKYPQRSRNSGAVTSGRTAVKRWAQLTETRDPRQVADASNIEIDRLNARAQHLRAERGELGDAEIALPNRHYGVREGDVITFTAQHCPPGAPKVENGTRGQVTGIDEEQRQVTVNLDGSDRQVRLAGEELQHLRLAYAQHVYRQQGATVERAVVVTGGWQTNKESSYVQASRARNGTDWFLAREELGSEGQDERRVRQLSEKMRASRRHTPTLDYREIRQRDWGLGYDDTLYRDRRILPDVTRPLTPKPERDQSRGLSR
ncbi:MAG TPA: hypothetical protein VG147_04575 [Solirubrobacteraceae bacterium]|nr:hypothetical protein [Solirubrobacteraceae bacterium]